MDATMTLPSATAFARLDAELARWLRARATTRATNDRQASPLDEVALGLRKLRATLSNAAGQTSLSDGSFAALLSRTYRWSIRMARELEAIEQLGLDPMTEWSRFESFAPFALAFFDSLLAPTLAAATRTPEVVRVGRNVDGVLASFVTAMTSSAMAA
jgi:hypothetical protein